MPVGDLPSLKTCPKCESQCSHLTSILGIPLECSCISLISPSVSKKPGHPQFHFSLCSDLNNSLLHIIQLYSPFLECLLYIPVNEGSVAPSWVTLYCNSVNLSLSSSLVSSI
ncbi:unnamed protein product [Moneuplotes crassus]|uniref:Uncharacterized protein n=1 Tax=Euplotes crassus TaxID=5936 RepID=A0AAD1Y5D5_EUPCR|nr:unnamed protein product [Moneuplotes crassus]